MYLYLKFDKTQPFTHTRRRENKKKKLIHVFEQLSNQKVSAVSLDSKRTVMSHDDWRRGLRVFSSVWQQVRWRTCWLLYKTVLNSALSKSSTPRRTNASIRSLSAEVAKPHQWNVTRRDEGLFTDNCRGLAILNVCILILITPYLSHESATLCWWRKSVDVCD